MLQRNLLHSAVNPGPRVVVLVGSRRTLAKAVRALGAGRRYTALTERLQPGRAEPPQGWSRLKVAAGPGTAGCNRFRSSPRSESAVGQAGRMVRVTP